MDHYIQETDECAELLFDSCETDDLLKITVYLVDTVDYSPPEYD